MAARRSNRSVEQRPRLDLRPRRAAPALRLSLFLFDRDRSTRGHQAARWAQLPQAMRRGRIRSRRELAIRQYAGIKLRHRYGRNGMKIGIVGAGQVGATAAYSMMMRRVGSGIVLVDRNADLAVAQARDILDATPFADPVRVRAGEFANLDGARRRTRFSWWRLIRST